MSLSNIKFKVALVSLLMWIAFIYALFFIILDGHRRATQESLSAAIRQADGRDDGELSQMVAEFAHVRLVRCLRLKKVIDANFIFDQGFEGDCRPSLIFLSGIRGEVWAKSLSGQDWHIQFVAIPPYGFVSALTTVWILGMMIIALLVYVFHVRSETSAVAIKYEQRNTEDVRRIARQVGHDLRSPIGALQIVVAKHLSSHSPESQFALVALGRINQIASDLLHRGAESLDWHVLNLKSILDGLISEKLQINPQCLFLLICPIELVCVRVPSSNLFRLLSNLIQNSIEAGVEHRQTRVEIGAISCEDQVVLSVVDNGKGISPGVLQRLRSDPTSYDKPGGNGLGLQYAYQITENAGGRIEIESVPGQETKISVSLPTKSL